MNKLSPGLQLTVAKYKHVFIFTLLFGLQNADRSGFVYLGIFSHTQAYIHISYRYVYSKFFAHINIGKLNL